MSRVLQITRGSKAGDTVSQKRLLKILEDDDLSDSKKIEALNKLVGYKRSGSFSNACFAVTFKISNRPIELLKLWFWGPEDADVADYSVTVAILKLQTQNPALKEKSDEVLRIHPKVTARQGEQFGLELPFPVRIDPDSWYRIAFMLNGPPTGVCSRVDIREQTIEGVKFVFYQSSKQLPTLEFRLA